MKKQIKQVENEIVEHFKKMHRDGLKIGSVSMEDFPLFEKECREKLLPLYQQLMELINEEQEQLLKIKKPTLDQQMRLICNERVWRILGGDYL